MVEEVAEMLYWVPRPRLRRSRQAQAGRGRPGNRQVASRVRVAWADYGSADAADNLACSRAHWADSATQSSPFRSGR